MKIVNRSFVSSFFFLYVVGDKKRPILLRRFTSRLRLKYKYRGQNKTMHCISSTHCGITVSCTTTMDTKTKKEQQKYVDSMRSRSFEYCNTIQSG